MTLAGGCFWCMEAVFKRIKGVGNVVSGYVGGTEKNPTYEEVSSGRTGHAEAIQITFNPKIISYKKLLDVFWRLHDPTTLNQQGADIGTQYRSVIFYHNKKQKEIAGRSKQEVEKSGYYQNPLVTKIEPVSQFYQAEDYHQDFYAYNKSSPYCRLVIDPKIQKLYKDFGEVVGKPAL